MYRSAHLIHRNWNCITMVYCLAISKSGSVPLCGARCALPNSINANAYDHQANKEWIKKECGYWKMPGRGNRIENEIFEWGAMCVVIDRKTVTCIDCLKIAAKLGNVLEQHKPIFFSLCTSLLPLLFSLSGFSLHICIFKNTSKQ